MKTFHISDVLTLTTGLLVSNRHMEGVYEILSFLTGDNVWTHQIPRVMEECSPWLKAQYPHLFPDNPPMAALIVEFQKYIETPEGKNDLTGACQRWCASVATAMKLPEQLSVYELGADMHTHIDPVEEAKAMIGDGKVIVIEG